MSLTTMYPPQVNSPATAIKTPITSVDTSITVFDASVLPEPPNYIVLGDDSTAETVLLTAVSGNALTVTRGVQGAARAWPAATPVARNWTAGDHQALIDNINTLNSEKEDAGVAADTVSSHNGDANAHKTLFDTKAPSSHTHTPDQAGADPAGAASSAVSEHNSSSTAHSALFGATEKTANKGHPGGYAELDASGKVPSSQLPSYVDDVLERPSKDAFPSTGENEKIYVALDTNLTYRWSGSGYVEISPSLALGETEHSAYRGDRGKAAYAHISKTDNPHHVTPAQVGADPAGAADAVQSNLDAHTVNKNNPHNVTIGQIGAAHKGTELSVTLTTGGWADNTQTAANTALAVSGYSYVIAPAPDSLVDYGKCGIYAQDITAAGQITFKCKKVPTAAISVNILKLEVE